MADLRLLRLALSGALAGVAVVGILAGPNDKLTYDLIGAGFGFAAVCTLRWTHVL